LWARRAAEKELPKAEYAVGYFTEVGIGIQKNPTEAMEWYKKAAQHGDKRAIQRLQGKPAEQKSEKKGAQDDCTIM
jgi:TPR repeat protein